MGSRNWLFTLNNPGDDEYPSKWNLERIRLLVYQVEMGEEGTIHLQGYLELESPRRLPYLRSLAPRAHWEIRKGSRRQALEYVTKEESRLVPPSAWKSGAERWIDCVNDDMSSFWTSLNMLQMINGSERGTSATSSRLSEIRGKLAENSSSLEEVADEDFDLWVRYFRAFEKYICMKTPPRNHPVDVHVVCGPTGTGKSKWAMETYPGAYWKQRSKWWDGYFNHETVIIDEYYGWLPFDLLLRLLDRYPLLVESKGGQIQFVARTIILTSNKSPAEWYSSDSNCYIEALLRRIAQYHFMPSMGIHTSYISYNGFKAVWDQHLASR